MIHGAKIQQEGGQNFASKSCQLRGISSCRGWELQKSEILGQSKAEELDGRYGAAYFQNNSGCFKINL
jgi:hypothetical protein